MYQQAQLERSSQQHHAPQAFEGIPQTTSSILRASSFVGFRQKVARAKWRHLDNCLELLTVMCIAISFQSLTIT